MNLRLCTYNIVSASVGLICTVGVCAAADLLVPSGATWKYLDNGTDQGTGWRLTGFNDTGWPQGPAQLGYGDGDEQTLVSFGPDSGNKYITTYLRRAFNVPDASIYQTLTLRLLRDDGAVVYLNGTEVFRSNMPGGTVGYRTLASVAIGGADETTFLQTALNPGSLVSGNNVLAVEMHQANGTSTDLSFDLELSASTTPQAPTITRGPYLQLGTPTSVVVRWRTDIATDSRVRYGPAPGSLSAVADDPTVTTEHEVNVTGLLTDGLYYYSVGSSSATLAGDDTNHFFVTFPPEGSSVPTRIWVLGDSGTANASAAAVRNAYFNATGSRHTDLWLMLGDNAYNSGTDSEYQNAVFNMYPSMLRKSVLFSTRGNHEADATTYYNIFNLPQNGEAGGLASGTEAYYSFDFGSIHFICLDSFGTSRSATGPMATWLRNDLLSTTKDWVIAFWHHPPYSKGSHNSDTETELVQMRQNFGPILEEGGVDLVLCGHSHSYERSFLIDGHYGTSGTFSQSHLIDGGSGSEPTPYRKSVETPGHAGAVYTVAGSSGQTSGGSLNHPAMFLSLNVLGSLVVDVQTNRLDLNFVDSAGAIRDNFTIIKAAPTTPQAPTGLAATAGNNQVALAWNASTGATSYNVKRSTVSGGPYGTLATGVSTAAFTDATAGNGTTYFYVVSAVNAAGESANSSEASATPGCVAPPAPTGLSATPGNAQVVLSWNPASGAGSYNVVRSTSSSGPFSYIAQGVTGTTYTDATAVNGTTYFYAVAGVNACGEGAFSAYASATPSAPASTSMHVNSLVASTVAAGKGRKAGVVEIIVVDNLGNPVAGATVTGTFTGAFTGTKSGVTDAAGRVVINADGSAPNPGKFTFCVSGITHATLTYNPGGNVTTCDNSWN